MVVAAVIGVGAGLGAVLLIKSIDLITAGVEQLQSLVGGAPFWMFLTLPAGIWLAAMLTDRFGPEAAGHGVPQIIAAIRVRGGRIPLRIAPLKIAATAITIGVGGSAGREGPIAQIGAALGSATSRRLGLSEPVARSLIAAGAAAGISATFNAPIAGLLFSLEVVLGSFSAAHLSTVVIASLAGAVVSRSLIGETLTFSVPAYPLTSAWELLLYGLLGVAAAGAAYVFLRQLAWWERAPGRFSKRTRPVIVALAVAAVGYVGPQALGTGQVFIEKLLRNEITLAWGFLLLLALAKVVATSATFGARGSGGVLMPSLFIGATLGSALATLVTPYWTISTLHVGAFALVGMAAVFAAAARAPLTAVMIVFETTGDYGLVLPLMLATLIAMILADRIHTMNVYTMVLARLGVPLKSLDATDLLDQVTVAEVISPINLILDPSDSTASAQVKLDHLRLHGAPVVENERLVGILSMTDILASNEDDDHATIREAMTPNPMTVTSDLPVSEAMHRMSALGVGRLPVMDSDHPDRLIGMFRREDAVRAYHRAVDAATHRQLTHDSLSVPTSPNAAFFDYEIPPNSRAIGRRISEITWPDGCLVVALQRGLAVMVASGMTELLAGDRLTCFGSEDAPARIAQRLSPPEKIDNG